MSPDASPYASPLNVFEHPMTSIILKDKTFIRNVGKDLTPDQVLRWTHLKSSPSTESLLSIDDGNLHVNPLAQIDYSKLNHKKIPSLETHIRQKHDASIQAETHCPWCNGHYFNWLIENGLITFISRINHHEPNPTSQQALPMPEDSEQQTTEPFQLFHKPKVSNKQARTRAYHNKLRTPKWKESSNKNMEFIEERSVTEVAEYTDHHRFAKLPKSQEDGRTWVMDNCLYNAEDLDPYPIDNNLFVLPSEEYMRGSEFPKYLIMRFDNAIPKEINDQIWEKWCQLRPLLRRFDKNNNTRDESPQAHFGMWCHYKDRPYATSDTRKQSPKATKLLQEFSILLRDNVVPRMWALLRRYDPITFKRHLKVIEQMGQDDDFMATMGDNGHIDFGGMFYAMAVKDGGSQRLHLDWMDHQGTYAWVLNIGSNWQGGDLCFPQLGKRVPTRPGQIIAFQGRYLAHCASPTIGNRLAVTCFTDRSLMGRALTAETPSTKKRSRNPNWTRKCSKRRRKTPEAR